MSQKYENPWENKKSNLTEHERMDILSSHIGALRAEVHSLSRRTKKVLLIEKILILFFVLFLFSFALLCAFILISS